MRKLRLKIEALQVESFDTSEAGAEGRGTVLGASFPLRPETQVPCFGTQRVTGDCCGITFAPSCLQTNCRDVASCGICPITRVEDTCT